MFMRGFKKHQDASDSSTHKSYGVENRPIDVRLSGEVNHDVSTPRCALTTSGSAMSPLTKRNRSPPETSTRLSRLPVYVSASKDRDARASGTLAKHSSRKVRSDEAGSAGDQDVHLNHR